MYITLLPEILMQKFLNRMKCKKRIKKENYNLKREIKTTIKQQNNKCEI